MPAKIERYWPFAIAVVAGLIALVVALTFAIGPLPKSLAAGTMTFGIVVAGFTATQRNMLLGMGGARVLRFAVRTGYHNIVVDYLMHCVYAGIMVSVVSLFGFFLGKNALLWSLWLATVAALIVLVLALVVRNERLMIQIVMRFLEDPNITSGDDRR